MAVDKGYGSGYKNTGKAKPAAPRARRARGSAKPNTPLSQMSRAQWNASVVQGQGGRRRSNGNFSANALENLTGFNSRDGVDAGDLAGLAISIPTGGVGGALLRGGSRVARAVIPKAARIAGAAARVSRGSRSTIRRAAGAIADAEYTGSLGRQYVNAAEADSRKLLSGFSNEYSHRGYGAFDENLGTELTRTTEYGGGIRSGEEMVRRGMAKRVETPSGAAYYSTALEETGKIGSSMVDKAAKLRSAASSKIAIAEQRATTKAASAEIRRRLAALRKAKEASKNAPKGNNPKKPMDWGAL